LLIIVKCSAKIKKKTRLISDNSAAHFKMSHKKCLKLICICQSCHKRQLKTVLHLSWTTFHKSKITLNH